MSLREVTELDTPEGVLKRALTRVGTMDTVIVLASHNGDFIDVTGSTTTIKEKLYLVKVAESLLLLQIQRSLDKIDSPA